MNIVKRAATLIAAAALALGLGGCGSAGDAPFAGRTLTVLYPSGVYAEAARSIASEFTAETGADLRVVDLPGEQLREAILSSAAGETPLYDAVAVYARWDGELAPALEELGAYLAEEDGKLSLGDFSPNVLANCGAWQGGVYGIPFAAAPRLFAYRADLYPGGLAESWEEYLRRAAEITGGGFYGLSLGGSGPLLGDLYLLLLQSMGGAPEDGPDSPAGRAALEALQTLNACGAASPGWLEQDAEAAEECFLRGGAAVCQSQPTLGLMVLLDDPARSEVAGSWALGLPPLEAGGTAALEAWSLGIPANSRQGDLAWEWIKLFSLAANQVRFYEEYGILPPRTAFWERDGIAGTAMDEIYAAMEDAVAWRIPAAAEAQLDAELRPLIK